jgi:hypothetical protein
MAVRGALAIGLPNYCGPALIPASTTWWGLYSLEIEMCAVAGRESSLRDPSAYRIPLPHVAAPEDPKQMFHTKMVHLANIVAELSVETTDPEFSSRLGEKSTNCLSIDAKLLEWKRSLPSSLDWETSSLVEPEWVSKQKVVLRNRTFLLSHISYRSRFTNKLERLPKHSSSDPSPFPDSRIVPRRDVSEPELCFSRYSLRSCQCPHH